MKELQKVHRIPALSLSDDQEREAQRKQKV